VLKVRSGFPFVIVIYLLTICVVVVVCVFGAVRGFVSVVFGAVLGFEFRASHLLGRHSTA
jgi:hypothetical protein